MSSTNTEVHPNEIPPWQRLGVNGVTAAKMMGCSRSTFFQRVKDELYPKPARDGLWNVSELRACRERLSQQAPASH